MKVWLKQFPVGIGILCVQCHMEMANHLGHTIVGSWANTGPRVCQLKNWELPAVAQIDGSVGVCPRGRPGQNSHREDVLVTLYEFVVLLCGTVSLDTNCLAALGVWHDGEEEVRT